ncbi:(d)CMP kinase [Natranaerofaba carboxydovora]|uniref:(d)CMP kinase n=1 Tax=Natranaerofaba carboxydovora TaxID=2742683 RepID=UPI001F12E03A|nr:cytidylate kinase family protein [Natranaerofaba carboxydovora]UMZ73007.1 Cytidylate kinase-like family protein [Natranaerofaba carboxydovora]
MGKITLTGDIGSGKSTVGKKVSKILVFRFISGGKIFREIAERKGLSVLELNDLVAEQSNIDYELDEYLKSLNKEDNIVVDSRLAWFFINYSFKIYLEVSLDESVRRISNDIRKAEKYKNNKELKKAIMNRKGNELNRYKKLYGVDIYDKSNYDLVIDTTEMDVDETSKLVIDKYFEWRKSEKKYM